MDHRTDRGGRFNACPYTIHNIHTDTSIHTHTHTHTHIHKFYFCFQIKITILTCPWVAMLI